MAPTADPKRLVAALKKWRVNYVLEPRWDDPAIDPYDDSFKPVGVLLHHTAGRNSLAFMMHGSFQPVRNASFLIDRSGLVHVIAVGSYHAGLGGPTKCGTDTIRKDDGNRQFWGVEVESLGLKAHTNAGPNDADGITQAQVHSIATLTNALLDDVGHPGEVDRVFRHKDYAGPRKIDMQQPLDYLRGIVAAYYKQETRPVTPTPPPVVPVPVRPPVSEGSGHSAPAVLPVIDVNKTHVGLTNPDVLLMQKALKAVYPNFDYTSGPGTYGRRTLAAVTRWQKVNGVTGQRATGVIDRALLIALGKKTKLFTVK